MSSLVNELKRPDRLQVISAKLTEYEELVRIAEALFELKGKGLEEANKEHAQNLVQYSLIFEECKTIEYFLKLRMEEVEGALYRKYIETGARALGATELKQYVRSDKEYVDATQALLDAQHVRSQLGAIVEAFQTMGWSLSNIVKLRVAALEHVVL